MGTSIGAAIGSGSFFTTSIPSLSMDDSALNGNQALGGSDVLLASFSGDGGSGRGGAVAAVAGNVLVSDSSLTSNRAEGGDHFTIHARFFTVESGSSGQGGAIYHAFNLGASSPPALTSLQITNSTISGNVATSNGPSGSASGGAIKTGAADVQVTNSTVKVPN